jgi:uncharacterized phage protein (TIGR01671 family)
MRELKFRFWDKSDKEWTTFIPRVEVISNKILEFTGSKYQRENITIQQYTGLKDAQGTEIYEGDILKYDIGLGNIYWEVIWDSVNGQWKTTKEHGGNIGSWFDNYLVAGNIFENPELIK